MTDQLTNLLIKNKNINTAQVLRFKSLKIVSQSVRDLGSWVLPRHLPARLFDPPIPPSGRIYGF